MNGELSSGNDVTLPFSNPGAIYQAMIKAMPDMIFVLDEEGFYREAFAEREDELLMPLSEIIGKNLADIFPPEHALFHIEKIKECLDKQVLITYEYEIGISENCEQWEARLTPLESNTVLCLVRNFSETRKAQKSLYELNTTLELKVQERTEQLSIAKANFEAFFNSVKDMLFVLDTDFRIIHVNTIALHRLHYSEEELIGQPLELIHYDLFEEGVQCKLPEIINGETEICELPFIAKNKEFFLVEKSLSKGFWNNKEVIFLAAKDISQLALSEEKFYKAFQSNATLIAISTFDKGVILDANNTFCSSLGFERSEVIGKTGMEINIFAPGFSREKIMEMVAIHGNVRNLEISLNKKNGTSLIGQLSVDEVYIGKNRCLMVSINDITERKHSEELLMQLKIDAERANKAKSEFLSRMSHELRTPLNSILGFAQLLEMQNENPKMSLAINHILESGKHLLDLINEVLDISRIEAGRAEYKPELISLEPVLIELIDSVRPSADLKKLQMVYPRKGETDLYVDPKFFRQIMLNLLSNAIKYNKEYGLISITIENELKESPTDSVVRIKVKDSGIGIAEDKIPLLFNPFERIGAERLNIEGTGLGLAVVKKLVENMSGKIFVDSKLGQGTCFTLEFPLSVENL